MAIAAPVPRDAVPEAALMRARARLLRLQSPDGHWRAELETNVTMDAEDLFLRELLGIREPAPTARTAAWIRSQQRPDGTWAIFHGGPAELSTTIEAYLALRLAGDDPAQAHMRAAAAYVRGAGGVERARAFTHIWLAMLGLWSWDAVPALPPEIMLLPRWVPLNIYDFACWARQTIVALTVVRAHRPVHRLPFGLDELRCGVTPRPGPCTRRGRGLRALDALLRRYERQPLRPLRRLALRRAERWILARQEADGSWGGIQPPWVYSLLALRLLGHELDAPALRRGIAGLESFTIDGPDGRRRLEACQSPVWDTALAVVALGDAGVAADDPALAAAGRWLVDREIATRGDWAVRRGSVPPGGWAFEYANEHYPDTDDTAEVVLALDRCAVDADGAIARAVRWVEGLQCRDGGWAAFDADNTRALCREIPFCDFGAVIDDPSADVTAHVVEMLCARGRAETVAVRRGVTWLLDHQEPDGSWFGRWGVNHVYGTGAVVPALVAAGLPVDHLAVRRALRWLERHQNADGGWGEDVRSYTDPAWIGRGDSTASQTAWALLALHAAGETSADAVERGLAWLAATQREDGGWDEPQHTGTGFPGDFSINYHLYRDVFPTMALGRCLGEGG